MQGPMGERRVYQRAMCCMQEVDPFGVEKGI